MVSRVEQYLLGVKDYQAHRVVCGIRLLDLLTTSSAAAHARGRDTANGTHRSPLGNSGDGPNLHRSLGHLLNPNYLNSQFLVT